MKRKKLVLARNNKRRKVIWRKTLSKNDAWFWKLLTRSGKSSFCNSSCGSAETSVREACECLFIMWEVWRTFYMFHICLWFLGFAFPHQHVEPERENNENPNVFISTLGQGERGRVGERFPSVKLHDDGALDMKFLKGTCLPNFRCCGWELSFQSSDRPLHDMKSLRKLFQSKNIIRRGSRWIWRQSSRSSPLSQSTCVVKACCAGEDGEETLTTNAGKK